MKVPLENTLEETIAELVNHTLLSISQHYQTEYFPHTHTYKQGNCASFCLWASINHRARILYQGRTSRGEPHSPWSAERQVEVTVVCLLSFFQFVLSEDLAQICSDKLSGNRVLHLETCAYSCTWGLNSMCSHIVHGSFLEAPIVWNASKYANYDLGCLICLKSYPQWKIIYQNM